MGDVEGWPWLLGYRAMAAECGSGIYFLHYIDQPNLKEESSVRELHQVRFGIITIRDSEMLLR